MAHELRRFACRDSLPAPVAEAKATARADLLTLLAQIQVAELGERWPAGIEYRLWQRTDDVGRKVRELATAADCFWLWNEYEGRMLAVSLDEWLGMVARRNGRAA